MADKCRSNLISFGFYDPKLPIYYTRLSYNDHIRFNTVCIGVFYDHKWEIAVTSWLKWDGDGCQSIFTSFNDHRQRQQFTQL